MSLKAQPKLFSNNLDLGIQRALVEFSTGNVDERGAVFTKREVVEFILDLVGYTSDKPLHEFRILEPSFGNGDFLVPIIERLFESVRSHLRRIDTIASTIADSISSVELHDETFYATRRNVLALLIREGVDHADANQILDAWLTKGDFLLEDFSNSFTHIVGNPPYVRQEMIPQALMEEYRSRFHSIFDRADLYVPFFEHSLNYLKDGGKLGFICSDRWMKNRYGKKLRKLITEEFHLEFYVDMVDTPAFHSDVIAYPAVTVMKKAKPGATRVTHRPSLEKENLLSLASALTDNLKSEWVTEIDMVGKGDEPWVLDSLDKLVVVRKLESKFPRLEEARCSVGIGVATGADKVFIGRYTELNVEEDRKLPLVMTKDILTGKVDWQGLAVINPFGDDGRLVDLSEYPLLSSYLSEHLDDIRNRHVSRNNPNAWFRTIDRIYPALAKKSKLLIPDIKGEAHIVFENGGLYPHHNLYFITSDEWDLRALQTVLKSGIARLFVSTYSTKMRGGFLRFQAQYLRRIRVPLWKDVKLDIRKALIKAADEDDKILQNSVVAELFELTQKEMDLINS